MARKAKSSINRQFLFFIFLLLLLPVLVLAVQAAVKLFGRAAGNPANIMVDASSDLGPLLPVWQAFAQGGEEKGDMLAPVLSQLKDLSPKYIRLDHIYDNYQVVQKSSDGSFYYDWSNLDAAVNTITKAGARPFLSLSYMPTEFAQNDIVGPPKNWSDWENLVTATIEHYSGKGPKDKYLSGVYYEVWNEPDLFGNWKTYGERNYLDLYRHSVLGANRAQNTWPFKIGGPVTTGLYRDWITGLLDYVKSNNLRLDFLSYHRYSQNPQDFSDDLNNLAVWLNQYPDYKNIPVIISEWGSSSGNSSWHDGLNDAIDFFATVRQLIQRVDLAFAFEVKDGPGTQNKEYWGRWGLITNEKFGAHLKPKYEAVRFLNQMTGERLELLGEGFYTTGLAAKHDNIIQILLINYDKNGGHDEAVPVSLVNLPSGNYELTTEKFLGQKETFNFPVASGIWKREFYLPSLSALLLTLVKTSDIYSLETGASGNSNDLALSLPQNGQPWILPNSQFSLGQAGGLELFIKAPLNNQQQTVIFSLPLKNEQSLKLQTKPAGFGSNLVFGVFNNGQEKNVVVTSISGWSNSVWHNIKLSWNLAGLSISLDGNSVSGGTVLNFSGNGDLTFNNFGGAIDDLKISDGQNVVLQRNFDGDVIK